jgi:glycerate-2-kinase/transketolase N-terminal domain/subunit
MSFIHNISSLAKTPERKVVLDLMDAAFASIQPQVVIQHNFVIEGNILKIQGKEFDLAHFDRILVVGIGKGSAVNAKIIEEKLGDKLTNGYVIDTAEQQFSKIEFTLGTHPLPSQANFDFTQKVLDQTNNLTDKDLVIVIMCGGGSVLFEKPNALSLDEMISVNNALLKSSADIYEMNIIRKHLSATKGGGFAKHLYPSTVVTLIFSDVPGNDLSFIASGPTVKDTSTILEAYAVMDKYSIWEKVSLSKEAFIDTVADEKYFANVHNILALSNITALEAMENKAKEMNIPVRIFSDKIKEDARGLGKRLIDEAKEGEILLAAGETTVKVTGHGKGGRNQEVVLAALPYLSGNSVITSFDSDGWDNSELAGAIGDRLTSDESAKQQLSIETYQSENNVFEFFEKTGDGVRTGKLPSNVSDLMIVYKVKPDEEKEMDDNSKEDKNAATMIKRHHMEELHDDTVKFIEEKAEKIRELIISMLLEAKSGHSAGPLGMADIFATFYFHILNHDPKNPTMPSRDRLVLSNGHICPVHYATLALADYFPLEELMTLRKINSRLQGHPHRGLLPGIDNTSGPLGEGMSQAIGMALASKMDKTNNQIYCFTSDGEHQEGNIWEAMLFAAKYRVDNLTVIIDRNKIQIDGLTEDVMPLEPLKEKYEAFNWHVQEVDGHNIRAIVDAVRLAHSVALKPSVIIAHTIPGKGVDFMENDFTWHGKPPNKEEAKIALHELRTLSNKIRSEYE